MHIYFFRIVDNFYKFNKYIISKKNLYFIVEDHIQAVSYTHLDVYKRQEVKIRREKIKDLLLKGLSQKEIYSLLKISKRTCVNDVKFLKEQGLI